MRNTFLSSQLIPALQDSPLNSKKFLPLDFLNESITKKTIWAELPHTWQVTSYNLADNTLKSAKKVFAILVLIDQAKAIKDLLSEGLNDDLLPLALYGDGTTGILQTNDGKTTFHTFARKYKANSAFLFVEKQWLMQAPIMETKGEEMTLHPECPLPFTETDIIGQGQSSIVLKAHLHRAHQHGYKVQGGSILVAVKQFKLKQFRGQDENVFNQEKQILERTRELDHPHLIKHFASCETGEHYFVFFPLADGKNLEDYWKRESSSARSPRLTLWALQQMLGVAAALEALHDKNIRHGDLKPENILHFNDAKGGRLVVADVGIARQHKQFTFERNKGTVTRATTPSYEAPEADYSVEGARSRNYDVWSLGCMFLEYVIWLLDGYQAVETFTNDRESQNKRFYAKTSESTAEVHPKVSERIKELLQDERCGDDTAMGALLKLIASDLLIVDKKTRATAKIVHARLADIVQQATANPSYLFKDTGRAPVLAPSSNKPQPDKSDARTSKDSVMQEERAHEQT
ncbi:kinase-like protein [Polyplosphaeria fusca]|uniref:Kinase-like protein n=1 Tax=Polyplosphaeria fusca TaxID=682080 RepID=A0A9P4V1M2_9PLEO|nr:kinase-like protein [Polyplosphaeria fusca]